MTRTWSYLCLSDFKPIFATWGYFGKVHGQYVPFLHFVLFRICLIHPILWILVLVLIVRCLLLGSWLAYSRWFRNNSLYRILASSRIRIEADWFIFGTGFRPFGAYSPGIFYFQYSTSLEIFRRILPFKRHACLTCCWFSFQPPFGVQTLLAAAHSGPEAAPVWTFFFSRHKRHG